MRTSPKPPTSPAGLASHSTSSRTKFPAPRMRPSLMRNESHQSWCTGKDSNLRTSQGGTDLQSVGFNHSPTCANLRVFPATNRNSRNQPRPLRYARRMMRRQAMTQKKNRVRAKILSHANTTLGKIPYGVLLGKICYAAAPRKMPCIPESKCSIKCWSWRRDLNPRPSDYKSDALPTELRQQSETKALTGAYIPLIPSRCPGQF